MNGHRDIRDDVWCLTCQHSHIATIPVTTYACSDCGFGAWATVMAVSHANQYVDHAVYVKHHQTVPAQLCTCNPAEVEAGVCVLCGKPFPVGGAV